MPGPVLWRPLLVTPGHTGHGRGISEAAPRPVTSYLRGGGGRGLGRAGLRRRGRGGFGSGRVFGSFLELLAG